MKRKILLLIPLLFLVGCTQEVPKSTTSSAKVEVNANNNEENKKEDKVEKKSEAKTETQAEKNTNDQHLDDNNIQKIVDKMLSDGFIKRNEDVKSDDTWVSISKYTKDVDKGKYIVFVNKADNSSKIHKLEDTQGYAGREMVETNNPNIKAFKNTDERFTMFVAYDESEKNGIIFMAHGSPKSEEVNNAMDYIKNLLKDII